MNEIADKTMDLTEATAPGPESKDPDYLAWVDGKIKRGQRDLEDPAKRHGEAEVWKDHGFED